MARLKRIKWKKIIECSIIITLLIIIFFYFSQQNKKRIFEQNAGYLQDNTVKTAQKLDALLSDALDNIKLMSYLYGNNLTDSHLTNLDLAKLQNHSEFDYIRYTDKQGINMAADGRTSLASDREYFIKGMCGLTGMSVTAHSRITNETQINFYTPLWFKGEIIGVLRGIYCADNRMKELLHNSFFGEKASTFLCLPDGKVIAGDYKEVKTDNLIDYMVKEKTINQREAEKIAQAFANGKPSGFTYHTHEGTGYGYMVRLRNIDWFLVQIFPVKVTKNMYEQANKAGVVLECSLIALFLLYILSLLVKNHRQNKKLLTENKDNKLLVLHERLRNNQYRKAIISGAIVIYEVNLSQDCLEEVVGYSENGEEKSLSSFMGIKIPCCFSDFIFHCAKEMSEEDRKLFIKSNNVEYLLSCFNQGKLEMQIDYDELNSVHGYRNMRKKYIFTQDPATEDIYVMIVTKDISDEVQQKRMREMKLQSQMEIIQALGREYSVIYLFNLRNDVLNLVSVNDRCHSFIKLAENNDGYVEIFSVYAEAEIYAEDRKAFLEAIKLNHVMGSLMNSSTYDVNYRRNVNGVLKYDQLRFMLLKLKNSFNIVFAFRSIDEMVREEIEQQNILAEALKKAKSAEKAKSIFLFNMSHDIRTPMNAIIGFNYLAQQNIDDKEKVLDALRKTEISSNHLLNLINDVLDMARIESGKMELNEQVIDVAAHIAATDEMFRNDMEAKGISFIVDNQTKTEFIMADSMRLKQVAANLLSNAMKFTKAGGTVIYRIEELGSHDDGTVDFAIYVRDNGIGMSRDFQEKIFSAFERERTSTISGIPGTGLGLAISQSIASLMGGSITCSSEPDLGSEFVFTFRAKAAVQSLDSDGAEETAADIEFDFSGKRALLAEDNELNREIATEILVSYGFEVEAADDGLTAVEMVKCSEAGYYDLILMDIQMPHMDGYEATRAIRSLEDKALADIPIIAMTANAFEEDKKKALDSGMNAHIAKPFDVKNLFTVIKKILG